MAPTPNKTQTNGSIDTHMRRTGETSMQKGNANPRPPERPPGDCPSSHSRDPKNFERQANKAQTRALLVAALHKLSGVLGIMALTWATVVLLGGVVGNLSTWDFYLVSALLMIESFRLFIIQIFIALVSRILYREKRHAAEFEFTDKQPKLVSTLNFMGQALSGSIAIACLFLTAYRIYIRGSPPFSSDKGARHIAASLWIFYMIVIVNFAIAVLSAMLNLLFRRFQRSNDTAGGNEHANSLATFYDTIYRTAIEHGITQAGKVELLDFAFDKIASDLKRNVRPLIVRTMNREMIKYMCENNGVEMVCQYLKGEDLWKRVAAANLPGFWYEEEKIDTKQDLFWSLRERVFGAGKDADGSLNSIECLARHWSLERKKRPHPFLVDSPYGGNLLDTIVNLMLMETRSPVHFRVRAFEACCRDLRVLNHLYREVDPDSEQPMDKWKIGRYLVDLIDKEVQKHSGKERGKVTVSDECWAQFSNSNLAKLCIKLAVLLSPESENVRIVGRIYSAKALMLLLQHCDDVTHVRKAAAALKGWIETRIILEPQGYYAKADMEAAEKVRAWVGLQPLSWSSVTVRDIANLSRVMSPEDIESIVQSVRGISEADHPMEV
ncbi:hypothetical protein KP509_38G017600 [Ceratopteris richardii]|uniref:Uncharacterized protein n=1 Tax=Ceratopteris richardii TaxID=49495 RepID=A0A8T2Q2R9_CERRI|nr:hypothetical protein KP509_38G017600 [Ceratopteris richardii]